MTQINLARLRDKHPAPREFIIPDYGLVGRVDGRHDDLVWVRAILERTAVVDRYSGGPRELVSLGRLMIDENDIPRSYKPTHDLITGQKIASNEEGRRKGRETQRLMRAAKEAARGQVGTRAQVEVAACG